MNEQMSDSYKKEVEEFKKWADNSLGRCEDFSKGISPHPRYERPYEPPMSPELKKHHRQYVQLCFYHKEVIQCGKPRINKVSQIKIRRKKVTMPTTRSLPFSSMLNQLNL